MVCLKYTIITSGYLYDKLRIVLTDIFNRDQWIIIRSSKL